MVVRLAAMNEQSDTPNFRRAQRADLPAIITLLADDPLGSQREKLTDPLPDSYLKAFNAIDSDPNNWLIVAEFSGTVAGTMQLTFLPGLSHQGSWRCQIEGVRVHRDHRSQGLGRLMISWAIEQARERNCRFVQLTSDKSRADALRFYRSLGFTDSHEGMKLRLD